MSPVFVSNARDPVGTPVVGFVSVDKHKYFLGGLVLVNGISWTAINITLHQRR
jgi:hypothetical protein